MNSLSFLFLCLMVLSLSAVAQTACDAQAKTDLERLFCQVQKTGYGRSLPSFHDFKNNSRKVQAALLRGPARQLGLKLPRPVDKNVPRSSQSPAHVPSKDSRSNTRADVKTIDDVSVSLAPSVVAVEPEFAPAERPPLATCRLASKAIVCASGYYRLQLNRANHLLPAGVLTASNSLALDYYRGSPGDRGAVKTYLVDSYQQYLEAMLRIGLGSSTMSFSKFYYTYDELQTQRQDFVQRFAQMYEFLKRDKSSMAIKASYHDKYPESLNQCALLDAHLIVCDEGSINWVYLKI
ncbi:hypothetical protein [Aurantivibrio plasticivorans]